MLADRHLRILSVALIAQAALFYGSSRADNIPYLRPLEGFSQRTGDWFMTREGHVDEETQSSSQSDYTSPLAYASTQFAQPATLFFAFFRTQRTGKAPHSPKNCLPGAGWEQSREEFLPIAIPGMAEPILVHEYVV